MRLARFRKTCPSLTQSPTEIRKCFRSRADRAKGRGFEGARVGVVGVARFYVLVAVVVVGAVVVARGGRRIAAG